MNFEEFQAWLSDRFNHNNELSFQTLGGRSQVHVRYDPRIGFMTVKRSTGNEGKLREDKIRRVFERYREGFPGERHMTSFYCDPKWPDTPDRVLAPYIAAVIKAWAGEVQ